MVLFNELSRFESLLKSEGFVSHSDLKELYDQGILCNMMDSNGVVNELKRDLIIFLDDLFSDYPYYYHKKIMMERFTNTINWNSYYILALYSGNELAYRNLPLILKLLIEKLDITKYKYYSIEDITARVYKTFDIRAGYDYNRNQYLCEIIHKIYSFKYFKYDQVYDYHKPDCSTVEGFSVWAEHREYDNEMVRYMNKYSKYEPLWVARSDGDGYGFDILSFDNKSNKERLIEVKSGRRKTFSLTENELKVMRNSHIKNSDYYIHKYYLNEANNMIEYNKYKYIPEYDAICDLNGNYYDINMYKTYDDYNNLVNSYEVVPSQSNKVKVLNN